MRHPVVPTAVVPGCDRLWAASLALCKIHHSAYDTGILGIDPDYRIHLRPDVIEEVDGPMLQHGLQEMHDHTIQVPRTKSHRPNPDYLAERFDRFQAA